MLSIFFSLVFGLLVGLGAFILVLFFIHYFSK